MSPGFESGNKYIVTTVALEKSARVRAQCGGALQQYPLRERTLLLIEHGDLHEIHNSGSEPLRTLNFYVPPAYAKDGKTLPRGKR